MLGIASDVANSCHRYQEGFGRIENNACVGIRTGYVGGDWCGTSVEMSVRVSGGEF